MAALALRDGSRVSHPSPHAVSFPAGMSWIQGAATRSEHKKHMGHVFSLFYAPLAIFQTRSGLGCAFQLLPEMTSFWSEIPQSRRESQVSWEADDGWLLCLPGLPVPGSHPETAPHSLLPSPWHPPFYSRSLRTRPLDASCKWNTTALLFVTGLFP